MTESALCKRCCGIWTAPWSTPKSCGTFRWRRCTPNSAANCGPEVRASLIGSSADNTIATIYADLGLAHDPRAMAESHRWLRNYTAELFEGGLPWCMGAEELLKALAAEGTPMALVTNTQRFLTDRALDFIGRHYFSVTVCGDEVSRGKPAPDAYRQAAELLDLAPAACLAIEDSVTGTAAAESAGCPVLVVPNDVAVPVGARRLQISSLVEVDVAALRSIHSHLNSQFAERAT